MKISYSKIIKELGPERVRNNELLAPYTTFKIGGPADLFCKAESTEELVEMVKLARKYDVPYFILGGGSNILVADDGFRGIVIHNKTSSLQTCGRVQNLRSLDHSNFSAATSSVLLTAESGALLANLLNFALKNGLSGLEFLAGIPGAVGGAIRANAGTADEWVNKAVKRVTILDKNNKKRNLSNKQCRFSYRSSRFQSNGEVILKADFLLKKDKKLAIGARMKAFLQRRRNQPKEPSAGCIFKNPINHSAGKLIDMCGLKGKKIGNAQISPQHANFIINLGKATSNDVVQLIKLAKREVKKKFGVELKEEICLVGFDRIEEPN